MLWLTWQMWILLALAFGGGVLTGWLLRATPEVEPGEPETGRANAPEPDVPPAQSPAPHPSSPAASAFSAPTPSPASPPARDVEVKPAAEQPADTPVAASQPTPVSKPEAKTASASGDDLTQIKGIGPKLDAVLKEAGVTRIAQIAAWSEADVERFDELLNFKGRIAREAWVEQARKRAG